MIKALLCDLDGTLLNIDFAGFMKDYLEGAARYFEDCIPPEVFQRQVLVSTGAILANDQPGRTMLQAFMDHFSQALTLPPDTLERFQKYYETDFPKLERWGGPVPGARELLEAALERGLDLVIATAPLFPEMPVRERLRWAGVDDLPYRLITSSEVMTRSKPFPAYYEEIAERLGVPPQQCLMVGDETVMDGAAARAGMRVALVGSDRPSFTNRMVASTELERLFTETGPDLPRYPGLNELLDRLRAEGVL